MSDLFYLSRSQFNLIKPYFPLSHGIARVDDLRVVSGIIHVIKRGLQWRDAPKEYGPHLCPIWVQDAVQSIYTLEPYGYF